MITKYWQAINRALGDALEQDDRVILYGEDVGEPGGSFGATKGLQTRFGANRVRDTPISEATLVGTAVGAAMTGVRPVVEIMFMDFLGLAMDQVVNQAAKMSYMSGGAYRVPLVIRTMCGAGRGTGPQHGQSFESWLSNVPGLKVVWPSCPSDAYGLLRSAIDDDDPVVVVESLRLWNVKEDVAQLGAVPIGRAAVRRTGSHVTLVSWGGVVTRALEAADICHEQGVDVEVLDLRTLSPLDEGAILESLDKTGRLVIAEDGPGHLGVGARIAALAAGAGFTSLRTPVVRVSSPFAPVPFSPILEDAYFPSREKIAESILTQMKVSI
jgi:pyruvate/2-oxoglutarate/acetoin dehydrogenase E1 component